MSELNPQHNHETSQEFSIRQLNVNDVDQLSEVLEQWVRDPQTGEVITKEVNDIKESMIRSVSGEEANRQYIVAEDHEGKAIGVMGMSIPNGRMLEMASTEHPLEIVNAFVSNEAHGSGAGSKLLENVESLAKFIGATELVVNSGPRYKDTAWRFYDSKFGDEPIFLKDYYGQGVDAKFWKKTIQ